jgi:hypothetical protein
MNSNYNIDNRLHELSRCFERFAEVRKINEVDELVINVKSVIEFMKNKSSKTLLHILELMNKNTKYLNFERFLTEFYYFTVESGFEKYVLEYFKSNCEKEVKFFYIGDEF